MCKYKLRKPIGLALCDYMTGSTIYWWTASGWSCIETISKEWSDDEDCFVTKERLKIVEDDELLDRLERTAVSMGYED